MSEDLARSRNGDRMGEIAWRDVTVAWSRPSRLDDFTGADLALMGSEQVDRFHQLTGDRALAFLAGRSLIRDLVHRVRGRGEVVLDSRCERCGAHHGPPRTDGVSLSVSHADDLVVVAVTARPALLGVDVEAVGASFRRGELQALFPDSPEPDLAGWTRIEAAVKADGRGLLIDPGTVTLRRRPRSAAPLAWEAVVPGRRVPLEVVTLAGPPEHVLSVALG